MRVNTNTYNAHGTCLGMTWINFTIYVNKVKWGRDGEHVLTLWKKCIFSIFSTFFQFFGQSARLISIYRAKIGTKDFLRVAYTWFRGLKMNQKKIDFFWAQVNHPTDGGGWFRINDDTMADQWSRRAMEGPITLSCYSFILIVGHLWAQLDLLKNASKGVR